MGCPAPLHLCREERKGKEGNGNRLRKSSRDGRVAPGRRSRAVEQVVVDVMGDGVDVGGGMVDKVGCWSVCCGGNSVWSWTEVVCPSRLGSCLSSLGVSFGVYARVPLERFVAPFVFVAFDSLSPLALSVVLNRNPIVDLKSGHVGLCFACAPLDPVYPGLHLGGVAVVLWNINCWWLAADIAGV